LFKNQKFEDISVAAEW